MSKQASSFSPSPIITTVLDIKSTASDRHAWVVFYPVCVPDGVFARPAPSARPIHPAPFCCCTRMSFERFIDLHIRLGDRVELGFAEKSRRPYIRRVLDATEATMRPPVRTALGVMEAAMRPSLRIVLEAISPDYLLAACWRQGGTSHE